MRTPTRRRRALLPALLLLTAAFAWLGQSLKEGENLLIQRKYKEAAAALEKALAEAAPAEKDRVLLLLGRARWLSGDVPGAVTAYKELAKNHAGSPLLRKARFQQAEALASKGRYREAAPIYRDEIARLVSLTRKEEVASTYLGLAEKALQKEKKDYNRAVTFFDLALDLGLSEERARTVRLQAAEARLDSRNYPDAIRRFTPLAKKLTLAQDKLRAMLGLGRAKARAGDRAGGRTVLRDLVALSKNSKEAAEAAYEIAKSYGVPAPNPRDLDRAVAALSKLAREYPDHGQSKIAKFLTARCYQHVGRSEDALRSLRAFLADDHGPEVKEVAVARAMVGDVLAGQGKLTVAIAAWREYLGAHPAHSDWERVQRAIVDTEYRRAMLALEEGKEADKKEKERFTKARSLLTDFAKAHPIDARNPQILFLFGEMLFIEDKFDAAREAYARCVSKYPGKQASSHAQFRIGEIYETKAFNYEDALQAYRKVTWGSWAAHARQRIAHLTRKSMSLLTERSFRTGEKAVFKLTSRNIEKVRVRIFKLDLETYFRATHTAGQVSRLDIEVIEPDKVVENKVEEYVKHKETTRDVEVGFETPGAYVVKVDDQELEATTMVLVTDVAMIAKSSRHEFFVFTQNLKENRVESGMKVVLSNGKKVIAEGTTNEDGVWRYKGKELQSCANLIVFATNAAGSGASSLSLSGMGYAPGLSPKCYMITDRPVYQPGHRVHIKGILREVKDGLYTLPEAKDYRLQVFAASGRLMLQRNVTFTEFGTFSGELDIPPQGDMGEWRIRVDRGNRSTTAFTGSFTVARYERPRLQLIGDLDKKVVFRGEKIKGSWKLSYYFGEPAIGKDVLYAMRLPDGRVLDGRGKTNAEGEVPFELETKGFGEEGIAVITARVVGAQTVATTIYVPVATTEFTPALRMVRAVYLVGEPFDVTVTLKDRSGKPIARAGTVRLLRREVGKRKAVVEVEVAKQDLTTKAEDGTGRVTFKAVKGGQHVVRVEVKDRFGTLVTGQTEVFLSGKDDEIKLRMLSDREHYKVGETVQVKVANRAGSKLCLQTIQGDGVLSYRAFRLPEGESTLELALESLHAPNFALALTMVDGRALHTAQREFRVSRDLKVTVTPKKKTARPGEEVEVDIVATDPKGRPVSAELALAMVDRSLLAAYPDNSPKMGVFFYGQLRETGFRTVSSCTWAYRGVARKMSRELLAEERREAERRTPAEMPGRGGSDDFFMGRNGRRDGPGNRAPRGGGAGGTANSRPGPQGSPARSGVAQKMDQLKKQHERGQWARKESALPGASRNILERSKQNLAQRESLPTLADLQEEVVGGKLLKNIDASILRMDQPRTDFSETGAWFSTILTNAEGKGVAKLKMPDSTTGWRIVTRGVTKDTYVGEGEAELRTRKELQVGLSVPSVLTEGDQSRLVFTVHNLSGEKRDVEVSFESKQDTTTTSTEKFQLGNGQEKEHASLLKLTGTQDLHIKLSAKGGGLSDEMRGVVRVQPFGMEQRSGRSGSTTQGATFPLSLPKGREYTRLGMRIEVGRDPGRDLIAAALGMGYRPWNCRKVDNTNLSLASRGIACLVTLAHLERAGRSTPADAARLRGLASNCLTQLVAGQGKDGGMAWIGTRYSDLRTTSQVVKFLSMAKARGMSACDHALARAGDWLLKRVPRAAVNDRCRVAEAMPRRAGFSFLNGLHRNRNNMDVESLARLAIAWQKLNRKGLAGEVLQVLRAKLAKQKPLPSHVEKLGLAASALLEQDAKDSEGQKLIAWLQSRRIGVSWGTPVATAAAVQAMVTAGGDKSVAGASLAEVKITVNGKELATVPSTVKDANSGFTVPSDWLVNESNRVRIEVKGRGKVFYSATLTGFAKGFSKEHRRRDIAEVTRRYEPAFRVHDGKQLQPGFGIIQGRSYKTFTNTLSKMSVGETARVSLSYYVRDPFRKTLTPMIVEEPIPAGCTVPKDSIRGNYDHLVVEPHKLTFYYREGMTYGNAQYELQGRFEGKYRVLPTRLFGALRPDLLAHGTTKTLAVLPIDSKDKDPYRYSPNELYQLGKALFDAGKLDDAGKQLRQLIDGWHKTKHFLAGHVYKDVARMMLFVSINQKDSKSVVRFFEDLKEQYPELVIPFDKIVAVGQAYLDLGEFEQGVLVFRATAESSFLKEAAVVRTLEQLGEFRASARFLRRLLLSYPDLNTIRISLYSIGQKLAMQADRMPDGARFDEKVGKREEIRAAALATFREFLILYPEDPMAEEVSFAWSTTCAEGKDLKSSLRVAEAALLRYPNSTLTDELLYAVGYARFALGQHKEAFEVLERVATDEFPLPRGGRGPSENKFHAIYLQGQIHHALGEPNKALAAYEKVKNNFSDAGEASDYFLRKSLSLPEVSSFGLDAKVQVKLNYRNIKEVAVQVYRVDLMRLYILQKSLNNIRGIQLHGISPYAELTVPIGDGRDYRTKEKMLDLDLKEAGAYLVVVRGDNLLATGMALRSDLKIEAQEFFDVGRIRVNVKGKEGYLGNAHVKVIGSGDKNLRSGDTDLRGIYVASSLVGQATVIVKKGDQYAFYRGKSVHQPARFRPPTPPKAKPQQQAGQRGAQRKGKDFNAFDNNFRFNGANRGRQVQWLEQNVLNKQQKGVEVYRTK